MSLRDPDDHGQWHINAETAQADKKEIESLRAELERVRADAARATKACADLTEMMCSILDETTIQYEGEGALDAVKRVVARLAALESENAALVKALLRIAEHGEGGGTDKFLARMARRALAGERQ